MAKFVACRLVVLVLVSNTLWPVHAFVEQFPNESHSLVTDLGASENAPQEGDAHDHCGHVAAHVLGIASASSGIPVLVTTANPESSSTTYLSQFNTPPSPPPKR